MSFRTPLALALLFLSASLVSAQVTEDYRLLPPEGLPGSDNFGESNGISADGRTVLAVARHYGAVVFHRSADGEWESQELVPSPEGVYLVGNDPDWVTLSDDGQTALLGARSARPLSAGAAGLTGAVIVFRLVGEVWGQDAVLVGSESEHGARFGDLLAVTPDGTYIAVGATYENRYESDHVGAVYVFRRSANGEWEEVARIARESDRPSELGRGLAMSADAGTIAVHYWDARGFRDRDGYVVVYEREGSADVWTPDAILADGVLDLAYGLSLDLSAAGDLLLLSNSDQDRVHVFRRTDGGGATWEEEATLMGSSPYGRGFGADVSLLPGREAAVVLNPAAGEAGKAFVFEYRDGQWVEIAELVPSDPPGPYGLYQPMASVSAAREWVAVGRNAVRILYLYDLSGVLTASEPQPISAEPERLSVARPNPFAATAELTLRLDRAEHVEAVLYDALGRAVARPFGGLAPAGETMLSVGGDGLPPGLYLLRVSGEDWQETRRLVRTEG